MSEVNETNFAPSTAAWTFALTRSYSGWSSSDIVLREGKVYSGFKAALYAMKPGSSTTENGWLSWMIIWSSFWLHSRCRGSDDLYALLLVACGYSPVKIDICIFFFFLSPGVMPFFSFSWPAAAAAGAISRCFARKSSAWWAWRCVINGLVDQTLRSLPSLPRLISCWHSWHMAIIGRSSLALKNAHAKLMFEVGGRTQAACDVEDGCCVAMLLGWYCTERACHVEDGWRCWDAAGRYCTYYLCFAFEQ